MILLVDGWNERGLCSDWHVAWKKFNVFFIVEGRYGNTGRVNGQLE